MSLAERHACVMLRENTIKHVIDPSHLLCFSANGTNLFGSGLHWFFCIDDNLLSLPLFSSFFFGSNGITYTQFSCLFSHEQYILCGTHKNKYIYNVIYPTQVNMKVD